MNFNENFQDSDIMQLKSIDSPVSDQYMKGPVFLDRKFSKKILDNSDIIEDVVDQQQNKPQKRTIYTLHNFKVETQKKIRKSMSLGIRKLFFTNLIKKLAFRWIQKSPILPKQKILQDILRENYVDKKSQKDDVLGSDIMPVIKLSNQCLIVWNLLKFLLCLLLMWWLPYKVSFQTQIDNSFEISAFILIIFDVIIKLNVEIIHEGQIINQRSLILKEYFQQTFISDVIYIGSYIFANFFVLSHYNQIFQVFIFFMNLQKLRRILIEYQESRFIQQTMTEIINLIELLLIVFYFAHIMACLWFYVGTISQDVYSNTWIIKYNLENEQNIVKYVYSMYWATASMVTVGYGDITGQNPYEILCSTILMFLSSGVFAFSINSIGITLSNFNQSKANLKRTLLLINSYMLQNNVSGELQNKIRNYLKFYFNSKNISDQNEINQIINLLQSNLKSELLFDVQSKIIVENQYLKQHFTNEFLQNLAQNLEQVSFTPQEYIYQQNEIQENHMYFIQKGQVALVDKNSRKQLQIFEKGQSFGDVEFFTAQPREITAQSVNFSQVLRIKFTQFLEIISIYEEDLQNFFYLKKQLIFRQAGKCIGCLQDNHFIWNCNKLKYVPNVERIVKKDLFYSTQKRSKINRKLKQKFNSKFNRLIIENQVKELQNTDQNSQIDSISSQDQQTSQFINHPPIKDQRKSIATRSRKRSEFDQQDDIAEEQKKSGQFDHPKNVSKNTKGISVNNLSRLSFSNQGIIQSHRSTFTQIQQTTINEENPTNNEFNFLGTTLANFDTVMEYSNFYPHNNCSTVLIMFQKFQLRQKQRKLLMISSNYRFFKLKEDEQQIQRSKQRIIY